MTHANQREILAKAAGYPTWEDYWRSAGPSQRIGALKVLSFFGNGVGEEDPRVYIYSEYLHGDSEAVWDVCLLHDEGGYVTVTVWPDNESDDPIKCGRVDDFSTDLSREQAVVLRDALNVILKET